MGRILLHHNADSFENICVLTANPAEIFFYFLRFCFPHLFKSAFFHPSWFHLFIHSPNSPFLVVGLLWFQSRLFAWHLWRNGTHVGEMVKNGNLLLDIFKGSVREKYDDIWCAV